MEAQAATANLQQSPTGSTAPVWSVAIMTSREEIDVLSQTIDAVIAAVRGQDCVVDVVANGNAKLAEQAAIHVHSLAQMTTSTRVRVWYLALGDKAHCINECIHRIWPGSDIAFFVDGYAQVMPNAMAAMTAGLRQVPEAVAASGIPAIGRSANALRQTLLTEGGMTGALFAVRGTTMQEMRHRGFRLPLGMYRTDGTMAAVFCFGMNPAVHDWDPKRIVICADATFKIRPKSLLSLRDLKTQFNRMVRLAWGAFISQAVRNHLAVRRRPPEDLPGTAVQLVLGWAKEFPFRAFLLAAKRPLVFLALWRAHYGRDWSAKDIPPNRIVEVMA